MLEALAQGLIAFIEFGGVLIVTIYCLMGCGQALRERQPARARQLVAAGALMGLNFMLAATVLKTLVASSWYQIGMLVLVFTVRTLLKWSLARELGRLPGEG